MAYHREEEVQRLITNLAQWNGDGAGVPGCGRLWDEEKIAERDMQREWRSSFRIPAIGVDAGVTREALLEMRGHLSRSLWVFYTSSLTFEMQAREHLGVAKSTYHGYLQEAHVEFMEVFERVKDGTRARVHAYAQSAAGKK
jgi:hypothetical protein